MHRIWTPCTFPPRSPGPGLGRPSSVAVAFSMADAGRVTVWAGPPVMTGALLSGLGFVLAACRKGSEIAFLEISSWSISHSGCSQPLARFVLPRFVSVQTSRLSLGQSLGTVTLNTNHLRLGSKCVVW